MQPRLLFNFFRFPLDCPTTATRTTLRWSSAPLCCAPAGVRGGSQSCANSLQAENMCLEPKATKRKARAAGSSRRNESDEMKVSSMVEVLVLPAAEASAQATLLAGRSCGQQRSTRSVQNGRGGQPSRSGDEVSSFIERSRRCEKRTSDGASRVACGEQAAGR